MKKICGIYCIENLVNGKKYIGKSKCIDKRLVDHIYNLRKGSHHNDHLQSSWDKYGESNFNCFVIEECSEGDLDEREIYYIWFYKTQNRRNGYNLASGGVGLSNPSEETRRKLSESHIGIQSGKNNGMYGKHPSEETRKKMSENHADNSGKNNPMWGKPKSEETRAKISKSLVGRFSGENSPRYGKPHSEESKKKISENNARLSGEKHYSWGIKKKDSSSKYFGVSKTKKNWVVQIRVNKAQKYVGEYKTEIGAAIAYDKYVIENGLSHPLNFPEGGAQDDI
jgi:group I intron endonuclease